MSLKIYYSDRIEDLAAHLKDRLREERQSGDPFTFSQVVVPNTNIAKWLQIRVFAKEQALCALELMDFEGKAGIEARLKSFDISAEEIK